MCSQAPDYLVQVVVVLSFAMQKPGLRSTFETPHPRPAQGNYQGNVFLDDDAFNSAAFRDDPVPPDSPPAQPGQAGATQMTPHTTPPLTRKMCTDICIYMYISSSIIYIYVHSIYT